jgi:phosphoribosyl-ATP pyrophosphohydrolase/phosphoribosyl-AMP cyclohydrolase
VIVPSIDLMDGKAVQLQQGRTKVLEREDVRELAERFGRAGTVAVVDLDAAMGRGENRELIRELCRLAPCRVGGGLRDAEAALAMLRAGAEEVVIGTAATEAVLKRLPRNRTVVALDAKGGSVATNGWTVTTDETPLARAARLSGLCGGFLYTNVDKEGMLGGSDRATARALRASVPGTLTLAGGISTAAEIAELDREGIDAQVGMALYTGALDLAEAFLAVLDFEKMDGLIPTVACDAADGRPRMLAYSSRESLTAALREGEGIYWSRSRGALWRKGESSGHVQRLARVDVDCDRDALLFFVGQTGPTCHTGSDRCFRGGHFVWESLVRRIDDRLGSGDEGSYTARVAGDEPLLNAKILEEAREVTEAATRDEIAWECADLLYFMSIKLRSHGLELRDVFAQLASRAS